MKRYGMPHSIDGMGIDKNAETFEKYYEKIASSSAVESEEEAARLRKSMEYLWSL